MMASPISPRNAVILLALLGMLGHLQAYSWLGGLRTVLPDVPEAALAAAGGSGGGAIAATEPYQWSEESRSYLREQGLLVSSSVSIFNLASAGGPGEVERLYAIEMQLALSVLRAYVLLSSLICLLGAAGAAMGRLLPSRIFVVHAFLDLLFSTLSIGALALLCTYQSVRELLCDEYGARDDLKPGGTQGSHADTWWDTPDLPCEDRFAAHLAPILLAGLLYTALRIQAFLIIQRFYTSLLRSRIAHYGYERPKHKLED